VDESTKTIAILLVATLMLVPLAWTARQLYPIASRTAAWTVETASQKTTSLIKIVSDNASVLLDKAAKIPNATEVALIIAATVIMVAGGVMAIILHYDGQGQPRPYKKWKPKNPDEEPIKIITRE